MPIIPSPGNNMNIPPPPPGPPPLSPNKSPNISPPTAPKSPAFSLADTQFGILIKEESAEYQNVSSSDSEHSENLDVPPPPPPTDNGPPGSFTATIDDQRVSGNCGRSGFVYGD